MYIGPHITIHANVFTQSGNIHLIFQFRLSRIFQKSQSISKTTTAPTEILTFESKMGRDKLYDTQSFVLGPFLMDFLFC